MGPTHCDFVKLRTMLITHMQDLQEVTHDLHYENFRSERLARQNANGTSNTNGRYQQQGVSMTSLNTSETEDEKEEKLREKDAELKRMQEMVAAMQEQIKQQSQTSLPSLANNTTSH